MRSSSSGNADLTDDLIPYEALPRQACIDRLATNATAARTWSETLPYDLATLCPDRRRRSDALETAARRRKGPLAYYDV